MNPAGFRWASDCQVTVTSILRVLFGRWPIVLTCLVACLLGGIAVMIISPPRYSGSARVTLDYLRPDPTTGTVVPSKMLDAYLSSQIRLLRDDQVAIPAAEALGWLDSPDVQAAYAARPPGDRREFASWVASQVISGTYAHMVEDSNIMEIVYNAESKELAVAVAEALRAAYIQSSIDAKRSGASASADTTLAQVEKTKGQIIALETELHAIERENNILVGRNGRDEESARLRLMAKNPAKPVLARVHDADSVAALQLRNLDAAIALRGPALGPANPALIAMQQQRALLATQVQGEQNTEASRAAALNGSNALSTGLLEQQKSKVLALREPIMRLRLLQDQLGSKYAELEDLTTSVVQLREESAKTAGSIAPVGAAKPSDKPVFPNPWLILPASMGLGLTLGMLVAIFVELMGRRVRSVRDLETAAGVPVLAVVPDLRGRRVARRRRVAIAPAPGLELKLAAR